MPSQFVRQSLFWLLLFGLPLAAVDWLPIDPAQRSMMTPKLEPNADAEILYWDFRVKDVFQGQDYWVTYDHYVRIKVYTEQGIRDYSVVELPSGPRLVLSDISARTIKPDGVIIEVRKDDVVERELTKTGRRRSRARVINFPGVEKGGIVEYRFVETRMRQHSTNLRIPFQREIPTHKMKVSVKPLQVDWLPYQMRSYSFNTDLPPMTREAGGYASFTLENRKSFRVEPSMPPEFELKEWMLIFYEAGRALRRSESLLRADPRA